MTEAEKHIELLNTLIADGFFLLADDGKTLAAIEWLMVEIERLTTENRRPQEEIDADLMQVVDDQAIVLVERLLEIQRLKNKCNSLWEAINKSTPEHYPSREDLTWEVIE